MTIEQKPEAASLDPSSQVPSEGSKTAQVQTWNENEVLATVLHRQTTGEGVGREVRILAVTVDMDDDYAWTWFCNLKMSVVDSGGSQQVARDSAVKFMRILFGRDMTQHPIYKQNEVEQS